MLSYSKMYIISVEILELIILELFVFVLLEPLKSAEPPISCGSIAEMLSIAVIEHCRVARLGFELKYLVFSFSIKLSKFPGSEFIKFSSISFFIFEFF